MFNNEITAFNVLLDDVYSIHGKTLTDGAKALFFRSMAAYPLDDIRTAFNAHVKDPTRGQ